MLVDRTRWPLDFPDVVVHTSVRVRDAHPDYAAAKAGDRRASVRIACELLSDFAVAVMRATIGDSAPIIVPVRAVEAEGINLIPDAMAHELGRRLRLPVTVEVVQSNTVGHTRASGFHRLAFQPTFIGAVEPGRVCVLVDDHVGLGSTLANLRGYIETRGGRVTLATTLSASRRSEVLALRPDTLQALRDKHGEPLERYWQDAFGFGLDVLTEAEAGYLLRSASVDRIRDRLAKAGGPGVPGRV